MNESELQLTIQVHILTQKGKCIFYLSHEYYCHFLQGSVEHSKDTVPDRVHPVQSLDCSCNCPSFLVLILGFLGLIQFIVISSSLADSKYRCFSCWNYAHKYMYVKLYSLLLWGQKLTAWHSYVQHGKTLFSLISKLGLYSKPLVDFCSS